MFKNALSVASAVAALFVVVTTAQAATVSATGNDIVSANTTYKANVTNSAGPLLAASNTFDFKYNDKYLTSLSLSNGFSDGDSGVQPVVHFSLVKDGFGEVQFGDVAPGVTTSFNFGTIFTGLYHLVFSGTAEFPSSVYGFRFQVGAASEAPDPTPLPAALALFGSVLFGGFSFAKFRRRRLAAGLA